jgi:metal-sulfur cluster biosynthetic enzyme
VENAVRHTAGVESVNVELVWDPPWTQELMSMRAKLELNMV